jgi:phosphatidylinositol alpha-1,6-mannosyltransferase
MLSRLSRAEDYKGHREVISAWPLVLKRMPDAQLWIAGDGDLRLELEGLVRANNQVSSILFFGRVTEQKKQELLHQSRCLALPSRAEGFGLVYLEAMRLGRPCLVSTIDAGREVVNPPEAGLAVNPGDKEAIAASLCRLLSASAEWREWSSQAKSRYESAFTARQFQARLASAVFSHDVRVTASAS